ncbi:MAG TPA: hypothetical protein VN744_09905 [Casimicrobiaceae bacterium]|jgi:hypothetical protein|nr:hypothetical protein [Casimicrobiaceae bacterium]
MVTQKRRFLSVAVTALVSTILIGSAAAVTLRKPAANAVITQNDPTIGCALNPTYGYGYKIRFGWSPTTVPNFGHYHLVVQHGSSPPAIDEDLHHHRLKDLGCGTFVIDSNLSGWHWQVTTFDGNGNLVETSELRSFSFAPCRLSSGAACFAGP